MSKLKDLILIDLTEILEEICISQEATVLVIDRESAQGLIDMIQEQLLENKGNS